MSFDKFYEDNKKKYGEEKVYRASETRTMEVISTGSLGIDFAIGGGIPVGTMCEIFGRPGVGKSSLSYYIIADAQRRNKNCVLVNIENIYDPIWAAKIAGLDNDKLIMANPSPGSETVDILAKCVTNPSVDVVILDSIGAMLTDKEQKPGEKKQAGGQSGLVTHMVKIASQNAWPNQVAVIFINQVRSIFDSMYPLEDSPGGFAKEHQAAIRINLKRQAGIATATVFGEDKTDVAYRVQAQVKKIKVGYPNMKAGYNFWNYPSPAGVLGIDREQEVIDLAFKTGCIEQNGAWYTHSSFPDGKVKTRAVVEELIRTDPDIRDIIKKEIYSYIPSHDNIMQHIRNIKPKELRK